MKYRKKPVIIDAVQYTSREFLVPKWYADAILDGTIKHNRDGKLNIKTLEGVLTASLNDYIIKGIKGEIYACKPDIFEATYEKIEDGTPSGNAE